METQVDTIKYTPEKAKQNLQTTDQNNLSKTRLYRIWSGMKNRCYNSKAHNYKYYGQRGISICKEWLNNFLVFYPNCKKKTPCFS